MAFYKVESKIPPGWTEWEGFVVRARSTSGAARMIQRKIAKETAFARENERFNDENIVVELLDEEGEDEIVLGSNVGS